jgi:hypothetical protein
MNKSIKQILFFLILLFSPNILAQFDFIRNNSFNYPNELEPGKWKNLLSLNLAKLPEDVIEEASSYIYAPLFNFDILYGLPLGFSAHSNLSTNFITLHFLVGPKWSYRFKRVSLSLGYDVAYIYGRLYELDFKSEVIGWMNYPSLTLGIAFNRFTLSFKTDATFLTSVKQFTDDIEIGTDRNRIAGISFSVIIEQPLWKDNFIMLSFKGNYTRFYYPAWAVFPTWDRYNFIPEVIMGLSL